MQLQVIEVAIGVIAAFLVVSLMASAVVQLIAVWFKKRSKDLWIVIDGMLSAGKPNAVDLTSTSIYRALDLASRRKRGAGKKRDNRRPSHLPARAFADGVVEALLTAEHAAGKVTAAIDALPAGPLKQRLAAIRAEVGDDVVAVKAGLENWFDDTMERLDSALRRWSQWFSLFAGIAIAISLNVSTTRIVDTLWNDSTLRAAVAESAVDLTDRPCPDNSDTCSPEERIEFAIDQLDDLRLPIGWGSSWSESGVVVVAIGWLLTGAATMLGAPFWFDLLTRAAGARARLVPSRAVDDQASATAQMARAAPAGEARTLETLGVAPPTG